MLYNTKFNLIETVFCVKSLKNLLINAVYGLMNDLISVAGWV